VRDEALTGEPAGQPLSRESFKLVQGADAVSVAEGNKDRRDSASACSTLRGLRTWHVGTLFAREPGDLLLDRFRCLWSGPRREGEESKPMKHGQEKSDLFIVALIIRKRAVLVQIGCLALARQSGAHHVFDYKRLPIL
jgi:hypothetical protein